MSWEITDDSAKNIYKTMYSFYGGQQMPDNSTGVFFGFANYTKDKLIYTIEAMKRNYSLGWFTSVAQTRANAIAKISKALYTTFNQSVAYDGIKKFCNWVYNFAKADEDAANYFSGNADYTYFDALFKDVSNNVGNKVSNAIETIEYGIKYPSIDKITPSTGTVVKWGLIIGGGLIAGNFILKKLF